MLNTILVRAWISNLDGEQTPTGLSAFSLVSSLSLDPEWLIGNSSD